VDQDAEDWDHNRHATGDQIQEDVQLDKVREEEAKNERERKIPYEEELTPTP